MAAVNGARRVPEDEGPDSSPAAVVVTFPAHVDRESIPGICDQARALLETTGAGLVVADTGQVVEPDLATVEAIVSLKLIAGRLGRTLRLRGVSPELRDLLVFSGLEEVVSC